MAREYRREIIEPTVNQPRTLLIMSTPKQGKSTIIGELTRVFAPGQAQAISIGQENNFNIVRANYEHFNRLNEFESYLDDLIKDQPFKYVAFDSLSVINQWAELYGTITYMSSPMGRNFNLKARMTNSGAKGPGYSRSNSKLYFLPGNEHFKSVHTLPDGAGERLPVSR